MVVLTVILIIFLGIPAALLAFAYYPKNEQDEAVVKMRNAALLSKTQTAKILCYNVQFMAGKDYVF